MSARPSRRVLVALAGATLAVTIGTGVVLAAGDDGIDTPIPVEPDGGIGETPIPVEPDGGIGDTPIPVEPDGGIGDTPGDKFPVADALDQAHGLLGLSELRLPDDVRIGRRGAEHLALTADFQLGRMTVELDDDGNGYRVTAVTVELPDGTETIRLTPG